MAPVIREPDSETSEIIRGMILATCLDGQCYELAAAVSRDTGWPMIAVMDGDVVRHAVLRRPDGDYHDARGRIAEADIGAPFGLKGPLDLRAATLETFRAVRPVHEQSIRTFRLVSQAAWPDLPWLKDSFKERTLSFLADLEDLSRRHGVWIRAPYPNGRPVLGDGHGDEAGYCAEPTVDGCAYVFDREFG